MTARGDLAIPHVAQWPTLAGLVCNSFASLVCPGPRLSSEIRDEILAHLPQTTIIGEMNVAAAFFGFLSFQVLLAMFQPISGVVAKNLCDVKGILHARLTSKDSRTTQILFTWRRAMQRNGLIQEHDCWSQLFMPRTVINERTIWRKVERPFLILDLMFEVQCSRKSVVFDQHLNDDTVAIGSRFLQGENEA